MKLKQITFEGRTLKFRMPEHVADVTALVSVSYLPLHADNPPVVLLPPPEYRGMKGGRIERTRRPVNSVQIVRRDDRAGLIAAVCVEDKALPFVVKQCSMWMTVIEDRYKVRVLTGDGIERLFRK